MATSQISVRNVDPKIIARLKSRAKKHGRSFSAELRLILHKATEESRADFMDQLSKIQQSFAGRTFPDSTATIRKDRQSH